MKSVQIKEHQELQRKNLSEIHERENVSMDGESNHQSIQGNSPKIMLDVHQLSEEAQTRVEEEFDRQIDAYLCTLKDFDSYLKNNRLTIDCVLKNIFFMIHGRYSKFKKEENVCSNL